MSTPELVIRQQRERSADVFRREHLGATQSMEEQALVKRLFA
ncbi:hypothetical protein [Bosea massiliensis]|uniref:Uncharacterized protein n=1 Tax=Bosea massiliensis TaxID=151419 RepID=A0ABW0P8D7_9HYPH